MALIGLGLAASALGAGTKVPGVGDIAPAFILSGSDGKTHRLADFKGKQAVVLSFDVAYFAASIDDAETSRKSARRRP